MSNGLFDLNDPEFNRLLADGGDLSLDRVLRERRRKAARGIFSHLFSFRGRVSRGPYFRHTFLDGAVVLCINVAIALVARALGGAGALLAALATFVALVVVWSEIAVTVKRLHDISRPGTHWFLLLVPLYNIYFQLLLLFKPGYTGRNRYGPDPLSGNALESCRPINNAVAAAGAPGEELLANAAQLERDGDCEQAFEVYKLAAEQYRGSRAVKRRSIESSPSEIEFRRANSTHA